MANIAKKSLGLSSRGSWLSSRQGGVTDEEQLVAAGVRYLISLTRKPAPSKRSIKDEEKTTEDGRWPVRFCINRAPAKFLFQWRIPIGDTAIRQRDRNMGASSRNATIGQPLGQIH